jgi:hypothetical protein
MQPVASNQDHPLQSSWQRRCQWQQYLSIRDPVLNPTFLDHSFVLLTWPSLLPSPAPSCKAACNRVSCRHSGRALAGMLCMGSS